MSAVNSVFAQRALPKFDAQKSKDRQVLESNKEEFSRITRTQKGRSGGFCMGIHAPWSKGKTLAVVFLAKERNEQEGLHVVANFFVKGVEPFTFLDDVEIIKEVSDTILCIDEIRRYMDSYMSRGQKARFISNLAADLGKQSCDFYYTDQHYNAAPPRVKVNLSMIAEPDFDEESQWVTIYLFESIENYIMKIPFFYFGFYGPDYWKYYDTTYKIEDFRLKFKVERYASDFMDWFERQQWSHVVKKINNKILNLWNQAEGLEFTRAELVAIETYINEVLLKGYLGVKS